MPRKRSADARRVLFGLANIFSGVYDMLERVEDGEDILSAGSRAIKAGQRRAKAIATSEAKQQDPEPVVIDAEIEE